MPSQRLWLSSKRDLLSASRLLEAAAVNEPGEATPPAEVPSESRSEIDMRRATILSSKRRDTALGSRSSDTEGAQGAAATPLPARTSIVNEHRAASRSLLRTARTACRRSFVVSGSA